MSLVVYVSENPAEVGLHASFDKAFLFVLVTST
jgi:hypothetical protein